MPTPGTREMSTPGTRDVSTLREISYAKAILEAIDLCLEKDPNVFLMGLGVDDPKGIFGTTIDLHKKYGSERVFDTPVSENALTGVAIGAATMGKRPILVHQRIDFALLSLDQIINNAAKWHFMFGGQLKAPITIRMIIGRGWGQGPQHSQSLQALFAHIPGLKVVMPATPHDAKGLFIASVEDDNPVIFLEHRWLHYLKGPVPTEFYREPLGQAKVVRQGKDATIVAVSYMALEAFRAAEHLAGQGVDVEVIDLRTVKPFDGETVVHSVRKTGRLLAADTGYLTYGVTAEILAFVTERAFGDLKSAPKRIACPDVPTPTSPALAKDYYPRSHQIAEAVVEMLGRKKQDYLKTIEGLIEVENSRPVDVPDLNFSGPF